MKVLCKIRAFSKGRIIKPGEILNMDKCPSWGKVIEEKEQTVQPVLDNPTPNSENAKQHVEQNKEKVNPEDKTAVIEETQEELEQKLDALLTKGLDLGIMIDGLEKLSIKEQIEKLETEINKKSEEVK